MEFPSSGSIITASPAIGVTKKRIPDTDFTNDCFYESGNQQGPAPTKTVWQEKEKELNKIQLNIFEPDEGGVFANSV